MIRIIAGPCQHESLEHSLLIAQTCKDVCDKYGAEYYFKASFDKANRSSIGGKRGRGFAITLNDFEDVKEQTNVKILTDVHTVEQIKEIHLYYDNIIDVLQIPAFLCRQTDLVQAACDTNKIVNIKKGQFLAPWDMEGILSKTEGAKEVWITERGTSFKNFCTTKDTMWAFKWCIFARKPIPLDDSVNALFTMPPEKKDD